MPQSASIDLFLTATLNESSTVWPRQWAGSCDAAVVNRILYHGIAGLLISRKHQLGSWPAAIVSAVQDRAVGQAVWELRHRLVLVELLDALASASIPCLLLKGTALAYDVYKSPALRARGDTDLFVPSTEIERTRTALCNLGFQPSFQLSEGSDRAKLQESWLVEAGDGSRHAIDLHWQALNAPALRHVLSWEQCSAETAALPRLSEWARRPNRPALLLHACVHKTMHVAAPYFVEGETYYGGDRLIWAYDIHLLASALSEKEWESFYGLTTEAGLAPVCVQGLLDAQAKLGTRLPEPIVSRLRASNGQSASEYLEAPPLKRASMDLRAVKGLPEKLKYVRDRAFPSGGFMRAKYPDMARLPVAFLHGRRILDLFRRSKTNEAAAASFDGDGIVP